MQSIKPSIKATSKIVSNIGKNANIKNIATNLPKPNSIKRTSSDNPLPDNPAKRVLTKTPLTYQNITTMVNKQLEEINKNVDIINVDIQRAHDLKKLILTTNDEGIKKFAIKNNLKINQVKQDTEISNKHYRIEGQTEIAELIDNDVLTNITFYDKNNNLAEKFNINFYKNDPEIRIKYKNKNEHVTINKDLTQILEIDNETLYYHINTKTKTTFSDFHNKENNKEFYISNKFVNNDSKTVKNIFHYYTEKSKTETKGLFLNEKANGDNHTGVIAFTPKSFEN